MVKIRGIGIFRNSAFANQLKLTNAAASLPFQTSEERELQLFEAFRRESLYENED